MKILVVSDTHRRDENYYKVRKKTGKVDMILHCGDIEGSEADYMKEADCPFICVAGNNDFFSGLPRERELTIGNYKVWLTHGHNYYVSMGNSILKEEARARGIDIVFYGHTHRPEIDRDKEVTAINPGSLTYPRQEGRRPSYLIMEIDKAGKAHFTPNYL